MDKLTVRGFMTIAPHTIAIDRTIAVAQAIMLEHRIRHLPVLDGERLAGIVIRPVSRAGGSRSSGSIKSPKIDRTGTASFGAARSSSQ
jgi:CBS domain-containing protein